MTSARCRSQVPVSSGKNPVFLRLLDPTSEEKVETQIRSDQRRFNLLINEEKSKVKVTETLKN